MLWKTGPRSIPAIPIDQIRPMRALFGRRSDAANGADFRRVVRSPASPFRLVRIFLWQSGVRSHS